MHQPSSEKLKHQFFKSENALGIKNLSFIWDQNIKQLVLMMDTNRAINSEIRACLKGNILILEAHLISSYGYQYRLLSCQAIEPKLIKVELGYSFWGGFGKN
jgi:hypothetical protein